MYPSYSSQGLSVAVCYSTNHLGNNEHKAMLLFKSHTVGLYVNWPSMYYVKTKLCFELIPALRLANLESLVYLSVSKSR